MCMIIINHHQNAYTHRFMGSTYDHTHVNFFENVKLQDLVKRAQNQILNK